MSVPTAVPPISLRESPAERWRRAWVFWEWCLTREACRARPYLFLLEPTLLAVWLCVGFLLRPAQPRLGCELMSTILGVAGASLLSGGVGHAARAVCWEISRELRDLVRLTGIAPGALLWCKSLACWWTILCSLLLLSPLAAFAVTQGGVTFTQLFAGACWLAMFAALMAGFAAVASVSSSAAENPTTTATMGAFLLMLLYHAAFWLTALAAMIWHFQQTGVDINDNRGTIYHFVFDFALAAAPVAGAYRAMTAPGLFSPLAPAFWLHFFTAAACLRMSHVVMTSLMRRSPEAAATRTDAISNALVVAAPARPRCTAHPLFWKDTHILGGGRRSQRIVDVLWCLLAIGMVVLLVYQPSDPVRSIAAIIVECLPPIVIAMRFDALLAAEFRQQTWSSLMLLPIDRRQVLWAKLKSAAWTQRAVWLPVIVAVAVARLISPKAVLMSGTLAALSGVVMCEVAALNRIAPKSWWIGPAQASAIIAIVVVSLCTWAGTEPDVAFVTTLALLLVYILPVLWWLDVILHDWTDGEPGA